MKETLLTIGRFNSKENSTIGYMHFKKQFIGYTLEDEARVIKVKKETRLRAGIWELKLRTQLTPLTKKYRSRYDWFEYHIEIISPDFTGTYIHNGVTTEHTSGCPLIGDLHPYEENMLNPNTKDEVFKRFYQKVYPIIKGNPDIRYFIEIIDHDIPKSL